MVQYHGLIQDVYVLVLTLVKMELHQFLQQTAAVKAFNVGMEFNQARCLTAYANNALISAKMELLQILPLVVVMILYAKMELKHGIIQHVCVHV